MTTTKLLLAVLFTAFLYTASEAQLIINEISNKNSSQIADEDGSFEDWIELYNPGNEAINMGNYCLSDDSLNLQKWTFPSFEILPANHLLVFASGKNRIVPPEDYQWESPVLPGHTSITSSLPHRPPATGCSKVTTHPDGAREKPDSDMATGMT